jgi:PHD/YefM family antitoxin component YafN of YafNO toxin-antitoxin module
MTPQIVTDDKGKKIGVFLTYKDYEKIMRALEEAADERAYDRAMRRKEETIPAREAFKQIEERRKKQKPENEV